MRRPRITWEDWWIRCWLGRHDWFIQEGSSHDTRRCSRCWARDWSYEGDWPERQKRGEWPKVAA